MSFTVVERLDALWSGELVATKAQGRKIVLLREEDRVYAYLDKCAHLGLPVSDGSVEGGRLTCAMHGWCYDMRTGAGVNPKTARLIALPVKIVDGQVLVGMPEDAS